MATLARTETSKKLQETLTKPDQNKTKTKPDQKSRPTRTKPVPKGTQNLKLYFERLRIEKERGKQDISDQTLRTKPGAEHSHQSVTQNQTSLQPSQKPVIQGEIRTTSQIGMNADVRAGEILSAARGKY